MSKSLQIAEAMAARLNAHLTLGNVSTVVDRQKDIASEINKRVLKAGGAVIVILFEGFTNASGAVSGQTSVTRRYTATCCRTAIISSTPWTWNARPDSNRIQHQPIEKQDHGRIHHHPPRVA